MSCKRIAVDDGNIVFLCDRNTKPTISNWNDLHRAGVRVLSLLFTEDFVNKCTEVSKVQAYRTLGEDYRRIRMS